MVLMLWWCRNYKHPEFKKQLNDATEGYVDTYFDKYVAFLSPL